ncbi:MAG: PAS domain-containing protein [Synechococcales bacterium]|nr:PAS domain-containing protein [Synechococcales bacterium]
MILTEFPASVGLLAFIPHGHCYLWKPGLVWLHALSDGLIALAYFSIPITLIYFSREREDLPYPWLFQLFGAFILTCGLTHTMEIWTLWHPTYWLSGAMKAITAIVSLVAASALIPVIPLALALPSHQELEALNLKLEEQVRNRTRSLQLSKERLKLAVRSANIGIWDWDIVNDRLVWDDRLYELYGISAGDFSGAYAAWEAGLHPDDLPATRTVLQQALAGERDYETEFRVVWPNGSIHWLESYGLVQRNDQGQPLRMIGVNLDITERKQAEEERIQTEKLRVEFHLLETTLNTVLAGYWDWHIPENYCYMSPSLKGMFGYEDRELSNSTETWQGLMFAEDLPQVMASFERHVASRGEVPHYNEVRYHHKDGSTIWVICAGQVIEWDTAGQPLRMVGCHVDISRLKQTEAQLQKSETHLRLAQRISQLGSWEFDVVTGEISWSDEVFRIFGRDPALGTPSFDELQQQFHPDDRDFHQQTVERAIATRHPYELECRVYRSGVSLAYIQVKGEPILNISGEVIRLVGTILDITERKQSEEQLRTLSDRLTLALQAGAIGTWDWDLIHDASWDQRMYEIYGLQELGRPIVYQDWVERVHPEDLAAAEAALQAAVRGERDFDVEFRIHRTDGELRWIKAIALVQRDDAGQPQRMTGINYDITERKQSEAKILKTTAQLAASNHELEAFAYSVSHDLRAPLRAIDGFSKALLEDYGDRIDAEGTDYFNRIRHNIQRMGMLIDDLLSLSRISRSDMRYTRINLTELVCEIGQELQAADPDRQVEWAIAPDVIVTADRTLMRVVFSNLLSNAWKFTSHRSAACIEFGIIEQSGETVYFIRDNGAGFDMAYSSKLFGVFQRLHNTNEFPGTGIGLAIVQRAIHRHGGQVWAEAAIERGATIYLTLPDPSMQAPSE